MRALVLIAVAACACGPQGEGAGDGLNLNLVASAGLLDVISAFQVTLVTKGSSLDCVEVQKTCLTAQVGGERLVPLKDAAGKTVHAMTYPISLMQGTPNTQDVSLRDLAPGSDYALIVEALSKPADMPRLAGSSCNYVKTLTAGTNPTVSARLQTFSPPVNCDPRIQ